MEIKRDDYLEEVKAVMGNGLVKVITGIRCCGKILSISLGDWVFSDSIHQSSNHPIHQ